ncbi:MAG: hypothetical protein OXU50_07950 [Gammaproteobacteria bacterium]|nr:hypothetical protein [Gammaproteobacteria bacterium]
MDRTVTARKDWKSFIMTPWFLSSPALYKSKKRAKGRFAAKNKAQTPFPARHRRAVRPVAAHAMHRRMNPL